MILTCPSCGTQYVVKDGAIPPGGRQVRCAACKHSWHQDPEQPEEDAPPAGSAPAEPTPAAEASETQVWPSAGEAEEDRVEAQAEEAEDSEPAEEQESFVSASIIEPRSGPEAEERAYEEAAIADEEAPAAEQVVATEDWREPPVEEAIEDDGFTPYPSGEFDEPPRRSPLLSILAIVVIVVILAAAFWFLAPPSWKAALGLAGAGASPLALVTEHMDRRRLESGNELLTVTGRVINQTGDTQDVPPLEAKLTTRAGRIVYSWTIAPPARSLAPGASAGFNSTEVNVPPGGDELTITVGQPA